MSFPISYCCHASPEAVSVSSPLQTYCIKTLVLGAMTFIYRGCCFITIMLAAITQEETVFAHASLAQELFLSGLFPFPRTCSDLVLGFFHHFLWCFIFLFIHQHMSLHKPVALCLSMPCKCFCFEMCWPWRSLMFLSPDTINKCTCGILHDNSKQYEGEVNIIMEKTMGFGSNLEIKRAGVKCLWFFWFPFKVWRRENTSRLRRSWEILRHWEDTAKMISGAVELMGLNVLMKVKTETTGKSTCFSVLQVHEDPRWDYEWPNRPPRAPWIPGTGWTNIPRRWVLKGTGAPPLWANGRNICPDGWHSLGGEATTQKQYLGLPLSLKTTQDLKHLNKTN